MGLPLQGNLC